MLHNLLRIHYPNINIALADREAANGDFIPGTWRQQADLTGIQILIREKNSNYEVKAQRETLKVYYNTVGAGAVSFQDRMVP